MAGIGFELRRHLRKETYFEVLRAYLVAGIIGSGPWLISIGSMLLIGMWTQAIPGEERVVTQFLATVTHLMAVSLVASGALQLVFVRFIADRLFEKDERAVAPNVLGALLVTTAASGVLGSTLALTLFEGEGPFRVVLVAAFVTLCDVWILSVLLSGLKAYRAVVVVFALGYAVCVACALALAPFGLAGRLAGFFAGHALMLFAMLGLVLRQYPTDRFIAFDFLDRRRIFPSLALTGLLFNAAVWVDKFAFWANPVTSEALIGPIRRSVVYDVPIFVAYLSVVPGMAVFFVRIETDFAEKYDRFFAGVRGGETLTQLRRLRNELVAAARDGIYDIFRIQGLAVAALLLAATRVLALFHIPSFYAYLFKIHVVGVGFQVVLLGIFTILFYLDYRKLVLWLCAFFVTSNLALSLLSHQLGPRFYGFGFAVSAAITSLLSLSALSGKLDRLEYETFMR
jgi:polysaccharide biosynthesis protein PelG